MPRHPLPPGPGRPRSDRRIASSIKLQPDIHGLWISLANVAFAGNKTRALEHAIRMAAVGLKPAEPSEDRRPC